MALILSLNVTQRDLFEVCRFCRKKPENSYWKKKYANFLNVARKIFAMRKEKPREFILDKIMLINQIELRNYLTCEITYRYYQNNINKINSLQYLCNLIFTYITNN